MPWPWLALIVKNVPWGEVVRRTPDIIAASKRLLEKDKKELDEAQLATFSDEPPSMESLQKKLLQLEQTHIEHAKLLAQIVEQLPNVASGMEVLAARVRFLKWCLLLLSLAWLLALLF